VTVQKSDMTRGPSESMRRDERPGEAKASERQRSERRSRVLSQVDEWSESKNEVWQISDKKQKPKGAWQETREGGNEAHNLNHETVYPLARSEPASRLSNSPLALVSLRS